MCGRQGIVLEIYGGAQGISLPSRIKGQAVIQNFFELCHRGAMFHKNDAVNQYVVDKV